jgi:NADH-quinone oxidoreductase subunit H
VFWFRATFPRLRIDQLMSFAWKLLIPLTFAQVFFNGLVLVYGWPYVFLFAFSAASLVFTGYAIQMAVRNSVRRPREERMDAVRRWAEARAASGPPQSALVQQLRRAQADGPAQGLDPIAPST